LRESFKIGTRGSLLALTQATQVKNELERISGKSFELVIIKTEGDQKTDLPLWQMTGANYFTKELDAALIEKSIDLVIHSYKDLSYERPPQIELTAITKRQFAHDILLIKKECVENLKQKRQPTLNIGTSSPRRIYNIEHYLKEFLPYPEAIQEIKTSMLRGNVNTRIEKLVRGDFDAIVLALAGLERLSCDEKATAVLKPLLNDLTYMVLPRSTFPSAAAQGALAIETLKHRDDQGELKKIIEMVHDQETAKEVTVERQAFHDYGGGCHLAVGINAHNTPYGLLSFHQGYFNGLISKKTLLNETSHQTFKGKLFNGMSDDKLLLKKEFSTDKVNIDLSADLIYLTSRYTLHAGTKVQNRLMATSGVSLTKKAATLGIFVNLSADALSDNEIANFAKSRLLNLFHPIKKVTVLSNDQATSTLGAVTATYTHDLAAQNCSNEVEKCQLFYWTSIHQYNAYEKAIDLSDKTHFAGVGKTADALIKKGLILGKNLFVVHSIDELTQRIKNSET